MPLVATARLHKRSILAGAIADTEGVSDRRGVRLAKTRGSVSVEEEGDVGEEGRVEQHRGGDSHDRDLCAYALSLGDGPHEQGVASAAPMSWARKPKAPKTIGAIAALPGGSRVGADLGEDTALETCHPEQSSPPTWFAASGVSPESQSGRSRRGSAVTA